MKSNIKVSVIIPAYNVEQYIKNTLNSVINQSLNEIEIIVINDGSTDNTKEIIEDFIKMDNRIILINKPNGGLSSARNSGISIAKGEYIQHIDGDDTFQSTGCEELYNFAKNKELDMVVVSYIAETIKGSKLLVEDNLPENKIFTGDEYLKYFFNDESKPSVCAKLIKRSLYNNILHPEEISLGEDLATTPRLALRANRIAKYHKCFLNYTYNNNSISRNRFGTKMYQLFDVFEVIRQDFKNMGKYEIFKKSILNLEALRINSFLVLPTFWNDEGYEKSIKLILIFLKENSQLNVPKKLHFIKKLLFKLLLLLPYRYNLRLVIFTSNIFSKIKYN